ncbi:MAG TPA: EAL domain-containing protein [Roseiarcus sp.]|jgi:diguanylate cyclase (GGDEF)-like protein/PAS domain S-box-containing protein
MSFDRLRRFVRDRVDGGRFEEGSGKREPERQTPAQPAEQPPFNIGALATLAALASEQAQGESAATIAALQAQLRRHEAALSEMPLGVCFYDAAGRLTFCNPRYAELYDTAPEGARRREIDDGRHSTWDASTSRVELGDGRIVHVRRRPIPEGGWVETHEETSESEATQAIADVRFSQQTLIDWMPAIVWVKDAESRFAIANKAAASQIGRAGPEEMIGKNDFELHPLETAQQYFADEQRILRSGLPMIDKEELVVDASGGKTWIVTTKAPLRNEENQVVGLIGVSRDITERRKADLLRDGQAKVLEMIAMNAPLEAVLDHLVRLVESQLTGICGSVLLVELDQRRLRQGAAPSLAAAFVETLDGLAIGPSANSCGTAVYRREPVVTVDIERDPLWRDRRDLAIAHGYRACWSTPILSHHGDALGVVAMYSTTAREPTAAETNLIDVATRMAGLAIERKRAEDRIQYMARHDALTGLPNRGVLNDRLSQALIYANRYDRWAAVVFVDLDNFKLINDSLGHKAGDELLKTVASRMVSCVRVTDTVVRLGGDEFVIVLFDQPKCADSIADIVQKVRAAITTPLLIGGRNIKITCSLGIATYPNDGADADTLLAMADAAMYRAKETGRDGFQFYTPGLNADAHATFTLLEEMRNAIAQSQFILFYQPQVDLRTGRVFAVEALLRWMHPTRGMLPPAKFIPLAEETGMIVEIGDWVLLEACRQNKAWQDAGMPAMTVSVNVSARQWKQQNLADRVAQCLQETGLEAMYLELELTESLIMRDVEKAVATMHALQALGVQLAIDDFGTGYSSLAALKTFPVRRLKIDRSFIKDLADDSDKALAAAVISLGQRLHLRVIAEGVETESQLSFLRECDCDEMQGFHFSRPVPAAEIDKLILGDQSLRACA